MQIFSRSRRLLRALSDPRPIEEATPPTNSAFSPLFAFQSSLERFGAARRHRKRCRRGRGATSRTLDKSSKSGALALGCPRFARLATSRLHLICTMAEIFLLSSASIQTFAPVLPNDYPGRRIAYVNPESRSAPMVGVDQIKACLFTSSRESSNEIAFQIVSVCCCACLLGTISRRDDCRGWRSTNVPIQEHR